MNVIGIIVFFIVLFAIACMVGRMLEGISRHYVPRDEIEKDYESNSSFWKWRGVS